MSGLERSDKNIEAHRTFYANLITAVTGAPHSRVAAAFAATPDHGPHLVLPGGSVTCPRSHREQRVMPPRRPAPPAGATARAAALGADTAAVLAWLNGRTAAG